mmetsp:Transcript_472/g.559  ORF Transcript_472/g.559 Transcript_472/m.559 type:complete len:159 (-) Transcript_472:28-504(-)
MGNASMKYNRGIAYLKRQKYKEAAQKFEDALAIAREIGDKEIEGKCLRELGRVCRTRLHRYGEESESSIEDRMTIHQNCHHHELGCIYNSLDQYDKAIEKIEATLAVSREIGDRWSEGQCLADLGWVHLHLHHYNALRVVHSVHVPKPQWRLSLRCLK